MQGYYNIPKYSAGGFLAKMLEKGLKSGTLSYRGLGVQANSFSKSIPELKALLNKLISTSKNGEKLSHEEGKKLIDLLVQHKGTYKSLNALIPKNWDKAKGTAKKVAEKVNGNTAQSTTQKAKETIEQSAGKAKDTIASRYQKMKTLINEHPKTTFAALFALGSGAGRSIIGKGADLYFSDPFDKKKSEEKQIFLKIDGQQIPIKLDSDGNFIPAQEAPTSTDDISKYIQEAEDNAANQPSQNQPVVDYSNINDLFEEDAW